ncbi:MAG: ferritin family protein [Acidobacteria bacterium]|nr:ferritin family protein [Acidobacteriota bacterium]
MIDEKLTALEIIGIAIRAEQDAYELYDAMARQVSQAELKTELERLAGEERTHERWLTAYYRQATGEVTPPPVPDVQITLFGPVVHDGMSLLQVLDVAIEKERAAENVYAEAQRRSGDPSGKRLLGELVEFERGHARKLTVFRETIARNPAWQEDAAGRTIQLEGP